MSNNIQLNLGEKHLELKRKTFPDEKTFNSFIKKVGGLVRGTIEYRDWVSYVKDVLGFKHCAFTNESGEELTIEIHHHPLTLFDVVEVVLATYIKNDIEFSSLDIARETLLLHYTNNIGYIPMVTSLHEKYHNGYLIIPPKFISGKWKYLLETPGYAISDATIAKCMELMKEANNKFDNYHAWQHAEGVE